MSDWLQFGDWALAPDRRVLLYQDTSVSIGSRAFDLLFALTSRAGELVTKEQLMQAAWPNNRVEESNLRVHMGALRKVLGKASDGLPHIVNEPGRGYRFVQPVQRVKAVEAGQLPKPASQNPAVVPDRGLFNLSPIIGREAIIATIADQLEPRPLITVLGPGGIGKTTVAIAVAEKAAGAFRDGIRFVDFAPLSDAGLAPSTIANALGAANADQDPLTALRTFLRDRNILVILDNCERVADGVAPLLEPLIRAAPGARFLATSREPLHVRGEWCHRLSSLSVPDRNNELTSAKALTFSAVRLFVDRASARLDDFEMTEKNASIVADICRKLDGLPLAIELAASRIGAFGLTGLAKLIGERVQAPFSANRTAAPRHRSLAATLDWSYETLPEIEKVTFRCLSIFAGRFTFVNATAVASAGSVCEADLVEAIANLVDKSLLIAAIDKTTVYRFLDTTRFYGRRKLSESGEFDRFARWHAKCLLSELSTAEREAYNDLRIWRSRYSHVIDDVRAAVDWAFSESGDDELAVALTIAAIPLFQSLSLGDECGARVEKALGRTDSTTQTGAMQRAQLLTKLSGALVLTRGMSKDEAIWDQALQEASRINNTYLRLRAFWGLFVVKFEHGDYRGALEMTRAFTECATASSVSSDVLVGQRISAHVLHGLGEQTEARRLLEMFLERYHPAQEHVGRFLFNQRALAYGHLAKVLWVLGLPDKAQDALDQALRAARQDASNITFGFVMAHSGCPVPFLRGDLLMTEAHAASLETGDHKSELWMIAARGYRAVLLGRQGDPEAAAQVLKEITRERPTTGLCWHYLLFLGELAKALILVGKASEAMEAVQKALEFSAASQDLWYKPEILRIGAEVALVNKEIDEAGRLFQQSLELSRKQMALSWELRTATSLARMLVAREKPIDAYDALVPVYARFTEGFDTVDLVAARELLDSLRPRLKGDPGIRPGKARHAKPSRTGSQPGTSKTSPAKAAKKPSGASKEVLRFDQARSE